MSMEDARSKDRCSFPNILLLRFDLTRVSSNARILTSLLLLALTYLLFGWHGLKIPYTDTHITLDWLCRPG